MKYVIWGSGLRGKRLFPHIKESVVAFIDSDEKKIGQNLFDKPIISYEEYKDNYRNYWIVISYSHESEIIEILNKDNIYNYFLMSDCPGEFQEHLSRENLKNFVQKKYSGKKKLGIYGFSLYAFVICDWLEAVNGKKNPIILDQEITDGYFLKKIKTDFSEYNIIPYSDIKTLDFDFVLDVKYNSFLPNEVNISDENIYDCSGNIVEYFNSSIFKMKNIREGERCFIVATGPSLTINDLDTLERNKMPCLSMNHIYNAFNSTSWRPDYYIADDFRAIDDYPKYLGSLNDSCVFFADTNSKTFGFTQENVLWHHFNYEYSEFRLPNFSEDFSKQCYMGSTVTYSCIQLACYLGFKEIYLLGVDFSYSGNDKYGHFYEEKELISIGFSKQVYLAYLAAKQYADSHGIKIYNATRGGKLEVFPRVDFDSLFEN